MIATVTESLAELARAVLVGCQGRDGRLACVINEKGLN
jgi:hypothetical protein